MPKKFGAVLFSIVLLLSLYGLALAIDQRHLPDPLPNHRLCQALKGGIPGMVTDYSRSSGTTYYTTTNKVNFVLNAKIKIKAPFAIGFYDADGKPNTRVTLNGSETLTFTSTNNTWSQFYTVTIDVNNLAIYFPNDNQSTHACLIGLAGSSAIEPTETPTDQQTPAVTPNPKETADPVSTPTSTPTQQPTSLNPSFEPDPNYFVNMPIVTK